MGGRDECTEVDGHPRILAWLDRVESVTEISERYRKRAAAFTERVEAVPAERWDDQSPCPDWKARDVVRHVCDTSDMFLGFAGKPPAGGPSADDDPAGAWHAHRDAIQSALEDPDTAATEYESPFGKSKFENSVDRFLSTDALVHTWDLARATGGDERLDDEDVHALLNERGDGGGVRRRHAEHRRVRAEARSAARRRRADEAARIPRPRGVAAATT